MYPNPTIIRQKYILNLCLIEIKYLLLIVRVMAEKATSIKLNPPTSFL